jgi:hypothetical protein
MIPLSELDNNSLFDQNLINPSKYFIEALLTFSFLAPILTSSPYFYSTNGRELYSQMCLLQRMLKLEGPMAYQAHHSRSTKNKVNWEAESFVLCYVVSFFF